MKKNLYRRTFICCLLIIIASLFASCSKGTGEDNSDLLGTYKHSTPVGSPIKGHVVEYYTFEDHGIGIHGQKAPSGGGYNSYEKVMHWTREGNNITINGNISARLDGKKLRVGNRTFTR